MKGRWREEWREEWDSNPRASCPANGFQDRRLRPLGHPPKPSLEPAAPRAQSRHGLNFEERTALRQPNASGGPLAS